VKLSRRLTQTLDEAQKRIERLAAGEDGEPVTEPMELEGETASDPDPRGAPALRTPAPRGDSGTPVPPTRTPRPGPSPGGAGELPF
jgi:hypothetical protein